MLLVLDPSFLDQFSLVIATQLDEAAVTRAAELCASKQLPLLVRFPCVFGFSEVFSADSTTRSSIPMA